MKDETKPVFAELAPEPAESRHCSTYRANAVADEITRDGVVLAWHGHRVRVPIRRPALQMRVA